MIAIDLGGLIFLGLGGAVFIALFQMMTDERADSCAFDEPEAQRPSLEDEARRRPF